MPRPRGPHATKEALDREVAVDLGLSVQAVREVTRRFVVRAREALAEDGQLLITGWGRFSVWSNRVRASSVVPYPHLRMTVRFSRGALLARALRERKVEMEKYAVDEEQVMLDKEASDGCPLCGKSPERHGPVRVCPEHGSEPFENVRSEQE